LIQLDATNLLQLKVTMASDSLLNCRHYGFMAGLYLLHAGELQYANAIMYTCTERQTQTRPTEKHVFFQVNRIRH